MALARRIERVERDLAQLGEGASGEDGAETTGDG